MTATGWTRVRLGDVARQVSEHEHDPVAAGLQHYVGLEHLDPENITVERWGDIAGGTTFTKRFRAGQLLFAKRRAYQRKAAVADFDGLCSGDLIVIEAKPEALLPELLPHIVHTDQFLDHALRTSSGSLSPRTKWRDLAEYQFDLPPLDRQRELAALLGSLVASARHSQALVRSLRALREAETEAVLSRFSSVAVLGEVIDGKPKYGASEPAVDLKGPDVMPYIRVTDITEDGRLSSDLKGIAATVGREYVLHPGDIVFARSGATAGKTFHYRGDPAPAAFAGYCIVVRPKTDRLLPEFLEVFTKSVAYRSWVQVNRRGGAQPNISASAIASMPIPFGTLEEQEKAVERVRIVNDLSEVAAAHRHLLMRIQASVRNTVTGDSV